LKFLFHFLLAGAGMWPGQQDALPSGIHFPWGVLGLLLKRSCNARIAAFRATRSGGGTTPLQWCHRCVNHTRCRSVTTLLSRHHHCVNPTRFSGVTTLLSRHTERAFFIETKTA
jgi:hypothetical protein